MEESDYSLGFGAYEANGDGTLQEHLEWGFEIWFEYKGILYHIDWDEFPNGVDRRTVYDYTNEVNVVIAEDDDVQHFLDMPFLGETVQKIIDKSHITMVG